MGEESQKPGPEQTDIFEKAKGEAAEEAVSSSPEKKKRWNTTKVVVWVCLINGIAWVWCSYILAWLGKDQIAESLSQVAVTEIVGVVLVYCLKAVLENLSKNNNWPDKGGSDQDPPAVG